MGYGDAGSGELSGGAVEGAKNGPVDSQKSKRSKLARHRENTSSLL